MLNLKNLLVWRSRAQNFIMGGDWALSLPAVVRYNLNRYWFDGLFAAASETIPINYLSLYLLALGANSSQVGAFSSLTSLAAAACLLPGALLVERYGRAKEITVWFGAIARFALLGLALLPLVFGGQALVWAVILLSTFRSAAGNLAFPAWMSITGDIVPLEGRGRYFGSRNLIMGLAAILTTFLVGEFITRMGSPQGYQISILLAFGAGMLSTYFFASLNYQRVETPERNPSPASLTVIWNKLRAFPLFLPFCFASAFWNFSLNVAGPFFNIYMVQDLKFTAAMVGVTAVSTSISKMFFQRKVGELSDRWGPGRVQLVSMFVIPILPFAWIFIRQFWQVVALNVLGGVLWGAFELASFNFLLQLMPDDQRARYSAIYQIVITLALAGGAALGSSIILLWGYSGIFLVSGLGRIGAALMFLSLMRSLKRSNAS